MRIENDLDINQSVSHGCAKLVPVLGKKILDCVNVNILRCSEISDMNFQLADLGFVYEDNAPICVDKIWYSYDYLGVKNNPIEARIGCNNINLQGINGYESDDSSNQDELFCDYIGSTKLSCCSCENTISLNEPDLEFEISNLIINVQGTIGREPFFGSYSYSGTLV